MIAPPPAIAERIGATAARTAMTRGRACAARDAGLRGTMLRPIKLDGLRRRAPVIR
jgi:hypothetical protein